MPLRDPRVEHEQNPLLRRPIIEPRPTRIAKGTLDLRQLSSAPHPKPVRHDPRRRSHRYPSQNEDGFRLQLEAVESSVTAARSPKELDGELLLRLPTE